MKNKRYAIIFPTKTFYCDKLTREDIERAIVLKDNRPKYVMWFRGQRVGRLYCSVAKFWDFEIKKIS